MTHGTLSRGRTGRVTADVTAPAPAESEVDFAPTGRALADLTADTHGGA